MFPLFQHNFLIIDDDILFNVIWTLIQYIGKISKRSCDIEDWICGMLFCESFCQKNRFLRIKLLWINTAFLYCI